MRKRYWLSLVVAVLAIVSLVFAFYPRVEVRAEGTISISLNNETVPQFDIISISDIPAYGIVEPSGCGEFKGKVKIRIDCYLKTESPYYNQYGGSYVPDTTSPEYLAGYKGELDKEGNPVDPDDYQHWLDSLPTVWQDNPFHSHFVYYDKTVTDDTIKVEIAEVTEYFYAFHLYCWENGKDFIPEWQKVPKQAGTIRDVFITGDSSSLNKQECETKADDIVSRTGDFDTRTFEQGGVPPTDLNIGEKGTIDIGAAAINRNADVSIAYTMIDKNVPATGTGTIDTWQIYPKTTMSNVEVATFYVVSGNNLSTRDYETIGTVTAGAPDPDVFTGLSTDVVTGDYPGIHGTAGNIEAAASGIGWWATPDYTDAIPCTNYAFTWTATRIISLYGTGTEAGGEPDITVDNSTWTLNDITGSGTILPNTTYYANPQGDTSAPSATVADNQCYFSITNASTIDIDLTVDCSDFSGGSANMTNSNNGSNGATSYGGYSWYSGQTYSNKVIMKTADSAVLWSSSSPGDDIKIGAEIKTQTNAWGGSSSSTATLTITASAS